jgi:hypothetical protein
MKSRTFLLVVMALASLSFSACSSNSSPTTTTPPPPATTYTIAGTVSGLTGTGLVLQDNGGDNLAVSASGPFTFATPIATGGAYAVTVLTQPSTPAQTCTVTAGTGTATANVTTVQVSCGTGNIGGTVSGLSGQGLVLQNNGANNLAVTVDGSFTFTTSIAIGGAYDVTVLTQPSTPGQTCMVTNGSGTAGASVTNVLVACTYTQTLEWGWESGNEGSGVNGIYGTLGTAAPGNAPGGRDGAISWTDATGNRWLFGGYGFDSVGTLGVLNDLWKYSANEWTWMSGSDVSGAPGMYGTLGVAAPANVPGARANPVSWTDASGNFWLFGGYQGDWLNDLWMYSATSGEWTWMGGAETTDAYGMYGTEGTAAPANVPGARWQAVSWTDATGNFWLFGGDGYDGTETDEVGALNDLWEYSTTSGEWTWMGGASTAGQSGTYGTQGTASVSNIPGGRYGFVGWIDPTGNLWLLGGNGYDSTGAQGLLNDLWQYNAGQWTWVSGSNLVGQAGTYGTLGTAAPGNVPGARSSPAAWTDAAGNLWLFGGSGYDTSAVTAGYLNDLWEYSAGQWAWTGGSNQTNQTGVDGTEGTASPGNIPGGRDGAVVWTDSSGNFWLFGGDGYDGGGDLGFLSDLWEYQR